MLRFKSRQFLVLAWVLVFAIIILSLWPGSNIPKLNWLDLFAIDKIGHFFIYAGTAWSFRNYDLLKVQKARSRQIGFALFLLGFVLEFIQSSGYIGRHFDIFDLIANIMGICTGLFIFDQYVFPVFFRKPI